MNHKHTIALFALLLSPLLVLQSHAVEENPDACDCDTLEVSEEEIAGGCPPAVKMRVCPKYREAMIWQERLQQERERRDLERRMEPRHAPVR